jgi:hypothetical protein
MAAFLDVSFTTAESAASALGPNAAPWTTPNLAISGDFDGAAISTMPAGEFGPLLVLTGNDISIPEDARITGIQTRVWATSTTAGGVQPVVAENWLTLGSNRQSMFGIFETIGPANWIAGQPPVDPEVFGASDSLGEFKAAMLSQAKTTTRMELAFWNNTGATRTVYIWNAQVRLWADLPSMKDVVERAFRKLAILSKDTAIEGDDLSHGLLLLNDMLFGWEVYGVDIGHQEREADEAFPLSRKYIEGTAQQLAERLSPDYQVPAASADRFFRQLQGDFMKIEPAKISSSLTRMPSRFWRNTRIR